MKLPQDFAQEVQQMWQRFLQRTEPLRPDLHCYYRALTESVWDVEDMVQETSCSRKVQRGIVQSTSKLGFPKHTVHLFLIRLERRLSLGISRIENFDM